MNSGAAQIPGPECARLVTLRSYAVLDTQPEPELDVLVQRVAETFQSRTAALTLLDAQRCYFFAKVGMAPEENVRDLPRSETFCHQTCSSSETLVVPDARADARFAQLSMVNRPDGYRFYAGANLVTPEGHTIGTLCVLDTVPRVPTALQLAALNQFSNDAMAVLERRRTGSSDPFPASPPPSRRTVLVVDDDPFIREFIREVLKLQTLRSLEAANGAEALATFRQHRQTIGLVLTDINMPVLDGLELVRALRREADPPAIAVMSGRLEGKVCTALAAENVTCILPKPFSGEYLRRALALLPA
jgi:CheY-like chemotaxis protein